MPIQPPSRVASLVDPRPQSFSINQIDVSTLTLLATIPSSTRQGGYFFQNQSADIVVLLFDDDTDPKVPSWQLVLDPAPDINRQGGYIDNGSISFTGRIRVYGTPGSPISMRTW